MLRQSYVWALCLLFLVPSSAKTQTAEETVAFLMFGVENGAKNLDLVWKQENKSPAKYVAAVFKRSVQKIDVCNYVLRDDVDGVSDSIEWRLDFNRISRIELNKTRYPDTWELAIYGDGSCAWDSATKKCQTRNVTSLVTDGMTLERHRNAYAFFRATFCKRAF